MSRDMVRWSELPPRTRGAIVTVGALDLGLRVVALADLRKRSAEELRGPKLAWGLALTLVSSAGMLPGAYFLLGRRRPAG